MVEAKIQRTAHSLQTQAEKKTHYMYLGSIIVSTWDKKNGRRGQQYTLRANVDVECPAPSSPICVGYRRCAHWQAPV